MAENLTGIKKAAILLMTVGEDIAAQVLQHMGPKEVQRLGMEIASCNTVSIEEIEAVITGFVEDYSKQTGIGIGSDEYVRGMLNKALGEDKAGNIIDRILLGRNSKGLEQLKWMESRSIFELIRNEHPQVTAIVLSYLDSDQSAEIIGNFSDVMRADIILRIATMSGIQPDALRELDEVIERQFSGNTNLTQSAMGGIKTAADILNLVEGAVETQVMDSVSEINPDLAEKIQEVMFVFDDLSTVDDRGIQVILREVTTDSLMMALKGADDELKEKIFANMSKRAAEMLRDDLEAAAPAKVSDVEGAQKEILIVARRLGDAGEIQLGSGGGEALI